MCIRDSLNIIFFYKNFYPESFNSKITTQQKYQSDWSFLKRFGIIGEIIGVELKLILRHKRTKSILYMSGFFLFYGLIFYSNAAYADRPVSYTHLDVYKRQQCHRAWS